MKSSGDILKVAREYYANSADIYHFILDMFESHCTHYLLLEQIMQIHDHNRLSVLTKKKANKSATEEELKELKALELKLIEQMDRSEFDLFDEDNSF